MAPDRPDDTRLLIAYLRPERRNIAALAAVLVVAMGLPLAGPVLIGRFVDDAIAGVDTSRLATIASAFLVLVLAGDLLRLVVTWLSVRMAWRVGNTLCLEPMVSAGSGESEVESDGWTVVTIDGTWAAHAEHTVLVGPDGPEVLTMS